MTPKTLRWLHALLSIPILGYIYGPVAHIPVAAGMVRFVIVPSVILSGLWMWKGHLIRRRVARRATRGGLYSLLENEFRQARVNDAHKIAGG